MHLLPEPSDLARDKESPRLTVDIPAIQTLKQARLVCLDKVVFRSPTGGSIAPLDIGFTRILETDDQPYQRRIEVDWGWHLVDLGWLDGGCSMIVVQNREGIFTQVQPTQEERDEAARKIVELSFWEIPAKESPRYKSETSGRWLIYPTECFRGSPSSSQLFLRCRHGKARCTITAFPR